MTFALFLFVILFYDDIAALHTFCTCFHTLQVFLHRSTTPLFYCIPILGNIFVWRHSVHVPYSSHPILWFQAGAQSLRIERMEEMRSQIDRYFPFYQASCHPNPSPSIWLSFPIIFTYIMLFYYILNIVWTQNRFVTNGFWKTHLAKKTYISVHLKYYFSSITFQKWLTCGFDIWL